mmetsp:Transcript_4806/g.7192  ORF Transcript_4806/g.7192 Transcript_4806/m.7192 type:complete len:154 (-) Transcript_4806:382-843(-)
MKILITYAAFLSINVQAFHVCMIYPDDSPYDAGFGGCETYAPGSANFEFCDTDRDDDEIPARLACLECGSCIIDSASPSSSPSTLPSSSPSETPSCVFYPEDSPYEAGFGGCENYAPGMRSNSFCGEDEDENGVRANEACMECGDCIDQAPSF